MKPSTRLSSAVFHLTPTRTRCDLIIIANDRKEKIASGLLNPFLAHLKTAQEQVAKGGYSILLEPDGKNDAAWFTKATLERFVRFVSTPEILERVYTLETEILQIEEAIAIQSSNDIGQSMVEDHPSKHLGGNEDNESVSNANEEKAIVLYKPGAPPPEANGSCSQDGNSKVQLLKLLETRKTVLQKEQAMAFARAVAAGFDIEQMEPLLAFAQCFGALRLRDASSKFMNLWKSKHETGQWLDVDASEALSSRSEFSAMNSSGIVLSVTPNKPEESNSEEASENNGKSGAANNEGVNPVPSAQQEYFHGQFPHLMFPLWPMHPLPGGQPAFPAYPVQGVPFYQNYNGNGPFFQPPHMGHSPPNFSHPSAHERSPGGRDSNSGSETWEIDRTRSPEDIDEEASHYRKSRKNAGGSNKKQSGVVVIRNINYITSQEKKSGSETDSASGSDSECENSEDDGPDVIDQNNKRSSKTKGVHLKSADHFNDNGVSSVGKATDDGHWQAFQNCLLRGGDEDAPANTKGMFANEKDFNKRRSLKTFGDDPLAVGGRDAGQMHDGGMADVRKLSGSMTRRPRGSGDDTLISRASNDFRENDDGGDIQFAETNGKRILPRTSNEDFMIGSQLKQDCFRNLSDPLAVNNFENTANKMDMESSHGMVDETLIVPFRSMSIDQVGQGGRIAIDIDSEIPAAHQTLESNRNRNKINYEPDDLNLLPERGAETVGYDPALDYEMEVCADGSQKKAAKDATDVKRGLRKSDKVGRSKVASDSLLKQRTGGPIRNSRSSKINSLEDARARAERLRSYKADLQKLKKEKEEAEAKRLEALKLERQKRIAARGTSASAKPSTLSTQTKQLPTKLSPATRGSKFSDAEPGSSSPLQRSKVRTSLGSRELPKTSSASKLSASSQTTGNRLTRSSSSLSETKRESNGVTPDSKASMTRIRRLSEPKAIANSPVTLMKARSAEAASKRKLSEGLDRNKMSAIITLDKSKAATLPELKIKTSNSPADAYEKPSSEKDGPEVNGRKPAAVCENVELNSSNGNREHEIEPDDNPIVEKTVVMLEYEKPSLPTRQSSAKKSEVLNRQSDGPEKGEKSKVIPEVAPQHASLSPVDRVDRKPVICQPHKQLGSNEVRTACPVDSSNLSNINAEKPYRAPHARLSSLEDPCTGRSEYSKVPVSSAEKAPRVEETVKAYVADAKTVKVKNSALASEKTPVKESSKGLRRLLKFGKKNHTSSVDRSVDSEGTSVDGTELDDNARHTASTSGVDTLKNLISLDETSTAGNGPTKTSRHFSLFSPFRNKMSEKKQAS